MKRRSWFIYNMISTVDIYKRSKHQIQLSAMPSFSSTIYGTRAAAALDAITHEITPDEDKLHTGCFETIENSVMTHPEGSHFEADILLSCSDINGSPIDHLIRRIDYAFHGSRKSNKSISLFLPLNTLQEKLKVLRSSHLLHYRENKFRNESISTFLSSVLAYRGAIRITGEVRATGPAFSDGLFGPHVAKVFNSLLALEIRLADNDTRPEGFPEQNRNLMLAVDHSEQRRSFALRSGKGTAFAGDVLVLQHIQAPRIGVMLKKLKETEGFDCGLMDALFPEFNDLPPPLDQIRESDFELAINMALIEVRYEMDLVITTIHGKALPVLMALHRRLGRDSPLKALDAEILCHIVEILITEARDPWLQFPGKYGF
jgi:hypothetical protein